MIMTKTPILFLIFHRPDTTARVFAEIKKQKPKYLYIAADGPRTSKEWEKEKCEETRKIVMDNIDRDCEVKTLFREQNLWCKMAVSGAISWFFEQAEEWIILEDDCLPDPSFFWFCEKMLDKYRTDTRIMHISGDCFLPISWQDPKKYFYSNQVHIRGRATRRRAWKLYDRDLNNLEEFVKISENIIQNFIARKVYLNHLTEIKKWTLNTRDYQRNYSVISNSWLAIYPGVNLISNIGFSADALHTKNTLWLAEIPTRHIETNRLSAPKFMYSDKKIEKYTNQKISKVTLQYIAYLLKKIGIYGFVAKILWYK